MNLRPDIVRCTIFFAPYKAGAYNADTNALASNATYKPLADSPAWLKFGDDISDTNVDVSETEGITTYIIVAGQRYPANVIDGTKMTKISFTTDALSRVIFELAFGADITVNTDFAQLSAKVNRLGWVKIQGYGSSDNNIFVADYFVAMKLQGGLSFVNELTKPKVQALQLYSTLNSGKLPTASGL
jgi:hypothetical protein